MKIFKLLLLTILIVSCSKKETTNAYFAELYPQVLEAIDIECTESHAEYYISALINGQEFCHDQDKVGEFSFGVSNKFTTDLPSTSAGSSQSNARHGLTLKLGYPYEQLRENFRIHFPDFELIRSAYDHLDSLIIVGKHDVMGAEDVRIPEGTSLVDRFNLEAGQGYLEDFLVTLNSIDLKQETGGINFIISSVFGNQDGSYWRFNEIKKTVEADGTYYFMDIEFECNLYHWPQYGVEGLWGEVREGRIVVKVKLED